MLTRILVQSHSPGRLSFGDKTFKSKEFHIVDLEHHKIHLHVSPPLLLVAGISPVLSLGDSVYIFGGGCTQKQVTDIASCVSDNPSHTFYMGSARLRFVSDYVGEWHSNPEPIFGSIFAQSICLHGKIYNIEDDAHSLHVFDPAKNLWDEITLPCELQGCFMSSPVLPDPDNNRIILHLERGSLSSPSLYAYYPMSDEWKLIVSNFTFCDPVAAVADDVIYFNHRYCPTLVLAYDLKKLKWLDVHLSKKIVDGFSITLSCFKHLLYLGDNCFCLAVPSFVPSGMSGSISKSCTNDDDDKGGYLCHVFFVKFRIERTDSVINLVPLSAKYFFLPRTSYVCNMVALS